MNLKALISLKFIFHLFWMGLLLFVLFFGLHKFSDCDYIEESLNSQIDVYKSLVDSADFSPEVIKATESKIHSLKLELLKLKSEHISHKNDLLIFFIIIIILSNLTMNYFDKRITKAQLDEKDKGEML